MFAHLHRGISTRRAARQTNRPLTLETLEGRELLSIGAPFLVDSGANAFRGGPLVASSSDGNSVFVWNQTSGSANVIVFQRVNAAGAKVGLASDISVSGKSIAARSVAMDAQGDFVIAYTQTDANNHSDVLALKFNASNKLVGSAQVGVGTFQQTSPVVAMDAKGDYVVAYVRGSNGGDVFAKRYDVNSNLLGVVNVAVTSADEVNPEISMTPDGRFDIAYELSVGTAVPQDIIINRYSAAGTELGTSGIGPFAFGSLESAPVLAMDNASDAVVSYTQRDPNNKFLAYDIEVQRISHAGVIGGDIQVYKAPTFASPTGIVLQLDGGASGSFAVSYMVNTLVSSTDLFDGDVAVVNSSNVLTRIVGAGEGTSGPAISTDGPEGFALTFAMTNAKTGASHIFGRFGTYS
jgi:hypothetical protein